MAVQNEYEKDGWHFEDTGGHVVVGWKNVTLKDGFRDALRSQVILL